MGEATGAELEINSDRTVDIRNETESDRVEITAAYDEAEKRKLFNQLVGNEVVDALGWEVESRFYEDGGNPYNRVKLVFPYRCNHQEHKQAGRVKVPSMAVLLDIGNNTAGVVYTEAVGAEPAQVGFIFSENVIVINNYSLLPEDIRTTLRQMEERSANMFSYLSLFAKIGFAQVNNNPELDYQSSISRIANVQPRRLRE